MIIFRSWRRRRRRVIGSLIFFACEEEEGRKEGRREGGGRRDATVVRNDSSLARSLGGFHMLRAKAHRFTEGKRQRHTEGERFKCNKANLILFQGTNQSRHIVGKGNLLKRICLICGVVFALFFAFTDADTIWRLGSRKFRLLGCVNPANNTTWTARRTFLDETCRVVVTFWRRASVRDI